LTPFLELIVQLGEIYFLKNMAAKKKTMSTIKQILRLHRQMEPIKKIARIVGISKNTVKRYIRCSTELGIDVTELLSMDDLSLEVLFEKPDNQTDSNRHSFLESQYESWMKELKRPGVTRYLLWQEYKLSHPQGYSYTQFCFHLQQFKRRSEGSMIICHTPGEHLYVDFSGKKMYYYDRVTGLQHEAEILVACLGYSQKAFVIALPSQKSEDFIYGMSKIFSHMGGSPKAIVPDNMKVAVVKTDRYEPEINQVFEDFANHYATAVIPTRALHPKDKALAENLVKISYSRVFAPLRDVVFTSIEELNVAIQKQVDLHNATRFQKREYSRNDRFESDEKQHLITLPSEPFRIKKYKQYMVQKNSHIHLSEDKHYYSVPYAYQGQKVDVIYTYNQVMIYHKGKLLTQHIRDRSRHVYTTVEDHMPSKYRDYKDRSPKYYDERASKYSPELQEVIKYVLLRKLLPEQNYKSCDGLLRLAKLTPPEVFKNACTIALLAEKCHYKYIQELITSGAAKNYQPLFQPKPSPQHLNIRGKDFFKQLF
jgi:transposase